MFELEAKRNNARDIDAIVAHARERVKLLMVDRGDCVRNSASDL